MKHFLVHTPRISMAKSAKCFESSCSMSNFESLQFFHGTTEKVHLICPETAPTILASTNIAPAMFWALEDPIFPRRLSTKMLCAAVLPGHVQGKAYLLLHLAELVHWTLVVFYVEKSSAKISQTGTQISKTCREF